VGGEGKIGMQWATQPATRWQLPSKQAGCLLSTELQAGAGGGGR
jgi:hypothetical protein